MILNHFFHTSSGFEMLLDCSKLLFDDAAFQGVTNPVMTFVVLDCQLLGSQGSTKLCYQVADDFFPIMVIGGTQAELGYHAFISLHQGSGYFVS